jgi:hypothetical protein
VSPVVGNADIFYIKTSLIFVHGTATGEDFSIVFDCEQIKRSVAFKAAVLHFPDLTHVFTD